MAHFERNFTFQDFSSNREYYQQSIDVLLADAHNDPEQIKRLNRHFQGRLAAALSSFVPRDCVAAVTELLVDANGGITGFLALAILYPGILRGLHDEPQSQPGTEPEDPGYDRDGYNAYVRSYLSRYIHIRNGAPPGLMPVFTTLPIVVPRDRQGRLVEYFLEHGYTSLNLLPPRFYSSPYPDGHLFELGFHTVDILSNARRKSYIYILSSPNQNAYYPLFDSTCTADHISISPMFMYAAYPALTLRGRAICLNVHSKRAEELEAMGMDVQNSYQNWELHSCPDHPDCPHRLRNQADGIAFYHHLLSNPHSEQIYEDVTR